jgi:hypothetical protein
MTHGVIQHFLLHGELINTVLRYCSIKTKEATRIGYNGFLFPHLYSGDGLGAFFFHMIEYKCGKRNPLYPIVSMYAKEGISICICQICLWIKSRLTKRKTSLTVEEKVMNALRLFSSVLLFSYSGVWRHFMNVSFI